MKGTATKWPMMPRIPRIKPKIQVMRVGEEGAIGDSFVKLISLSAHSGDKTMPACPPRENVRESNFLRNKCVFCKRHFPTL